VPCYTVADWLTYAVPHCVADHYVADDCGSH
jgi:hypothetical protein